MCCQVIALLTLSNEGAQFYILPGHFLLTHFAHHYVLSFGVKWHFAFCNAACQTGLGFGITSFKLLCEAHIGHFRRVGHKRNHGVVHVAVNGFLHGFCQQRSEAFALIVNVSVVAAREVNALKRTLFSLFGVKHLLQMIISFIVDHDGGTGSEFFHLVSLQVEGGEYNRTLACHNNHFVIGIIERGTDTVGVAQCPHRAVARNAAYHIAAVPFGGTAVKDVADVDIAGYFLTQLHAAQSGCMIQLIDTFILAVQGMANLLKKDKTVGIIARMLTQVGDFFKNGINVGKVEIAAQKHIPGSPVVAAHERMDMVKPRPSRGAVTQMPHIDLTHKRKSVKGFTFGHAAVYLIMN